VPVWHTNESVKIESGELRRERPTVQTVNVRKFNSHVFGPNNVARDGLSKLQEAEGRVRVLANPTSQPQPARYEHFSVACLKKRIYLYHQAHS
jgi:ubiquitin C-terminal hydrolase